MKRRRVACPFMTALIRKVPKSRLDAVPWCPDAVGPAPLCQGQLSRATHSGSRGPDVLSDSSSPIRTPPLGCDFEHHHPSRASPNPSHHPPHTPRHPSSTLSFPSLHSQLSYTTYQPPSHSLGTPSRPRRPRPPPSPHRLALDTLPLLSPLRFIGTSLSSHRPSFHPADHARFSHPLNPAKAQPA